MSYILDWVSQVLKAMVRMGAHTRNKDVGNLACIRYVCCHVHRSKCQAYGYIGIGMPFTASTLHLVITVRAAIFFARSKSRTPRCPPMMPFFFEPLPTTHHCPVDCVPYMNQM